MDNDNKYKSRAINIHQPKMASEIMPEYISVLAFLKLAKMNEFLYHFPQSAFNIAFFGNFCISYSRSCHTTFFNHSFPISHRRNHLMQAAAFSMRLRDFSTLKLYFNKPEVLESENSNLGPRS